MVGRIIDTPIRNASHRRDGLQLMLSDVADLADDAELVIQIAYRGMLDECRSAAINQAIVLALTRNALNAQIRAISQAHGPIPEERPNRGAA